MGESSTVSIEQAAAEPAAVAGSVLTTILARNERLGKTSRLLGRMCFIGQVPSQQQAELVAWHEAAVADLTTEAAPENVTGLLLLYPAHFVHVIEAELSQLTEFARAIVPLAAAEKMAAEIRVLASTDDIPSRMFPAWLSSMVRQHGGGAVTGDDVVRMPLPTRIAETYLSMLKIGRALGSAREADRATMLADLRARHGALLPTQEVLAEVSHAEDALTVGEFCDVFCRPIDIKLDREIVWPIETELVY